jgi:hypothetical protein
MHRWSSRPAAGSLWISAAVAMLDLLFQLGGGMTAPEAGQQDATPSLACTPAAIRTVLTANADPDTLRRSDAELNARFE